MTHSSLAKTFVFPTLFLPFGNVGSSGTSDISAISVGLSSIFDLLLT